MPYLDLLRPDGRQARGPDAVVRGPHESVAWVVDATESRATAGELSSLRRNLSYRDDAPYMLVIEPGRLTVYGVALDSSTLAKARLDPRTRAAPLPRSSARPRTSRSPPHLVAAGMSLVDGNRRGETKGRVDPRPAGRDRRPGRNRGIGIGGRGGPLAQKEGASTPPVSPVAQPGHRRRGGLLTPTTISLYESGDLGPSLTALRVLAKAHVVEPAELLRSRAPSRPRRRRTRWRRRCWRCCGGCPKTTGRGSWGWRGGWEREHRDAQGCA